MKVLFFISVHGHGRGGHFHSLNHIANQIAREHEVKIISVGPGNSPIMRENIHFWRHVYFNGGNIFEVRGRFKSILQQFSPDILHFFDVGSYEILRFLVSFKKYKVVVNKCGGPNPRYYPYVKNLVVFSQENYEWFRRRKKFNDAHISLIANRVQPICLDPLFQPEKKELGKFNFVRICRIGTTYQKSIEDSINLISNLISKGLTQVRLYIIGVVENNEVYNLLLSKAKIYDKYIKFITDTKKTKEASKMLYLADAVIGTGRGFMEAASLGIPLFAINSRDTYPILIDKSNYQDAFRTNFSERNNFSNYDRQGNLNKVEKLILDKGYRKMLSSFSRSIFENDFGVGRALQRYTEVYNKMDTSTSKFLDYILGIKNVWLFYKSSKRQKGLY